MDPEQTFRCETFKIEMPADKQRGFCAVQFRKGREICIDCERGRTAAKEDAGEVRSSLIAADKKNRSLAGERSAKIRKTNGSKDEGVNMADKVLCSCGCGKGAVKDGLATKCYRKKHGVAPFPSGQKKTLKARPGQAKSSQGKNRRVKGNGHDHECEGCKTLQLQINDLNLAEKIMVAAGLATAEKFEQARKIARELAK